MLKFNELHKSAIQTVGKELKSAECKLVIYIIIKLTIQQMLKFNRSLQQFRQRSEVPMTQTHDHFSAANRCIQQASASVQAVQRSYPRTTWVFSLPTWHMLLAGHSPTSARHQCESLLEALDKHAGSSQQSYTCSWIASLSRPNTNSADTSSPTL